MQPRGMRLLILAALILGGCTSAPLRGCDSVAGRLLDNVGRVYCEAGPRIERPTLQALHDLRPPNQRAVVAVYGLPDLTGARKESDNMALFSTAVTQGADAFLIEALQAAGGGTWFIVVERGGLDHLTRERQLIKSTRNTYDGEGANKLKPLLFAGLLLEGGIIAYDTNEITGGIGARLLGIGTQNQYRRDRVTISLRLVLVQTGQVLINVTTSKSIFSVAAGLDTFRFIEMGTKLIEFERGQTRNELPGYAVRAAIEAAVYGLVMKGIDQDLWDMSAEGETE